MTQFLKYILQVFGLALFLTFLGMFIWSLLQPPVTEGPMPSPALNH